MPPDYDYCDGVDGYDLPCTPIYDEIEQYFGTEGSPGWMIEKVIKQVVPGITEMLQPCPDIFCPRNLILDPLLVQIIHLNDRHEWTREQIAEWLEVLDVDLTIRPSSREADSEKPLPTENA